MKRRGIRTDHIKPAIRYKDAGKKPPSMAALYQAAETGAISGEYAMTTLYAKIGRGGKGGAAALGAWLDALE